MWETIELRELRVFLALADELHFGRAAERLGLTQSRVSQSLRELEAKLGNQLLHRTSRRVALTESGERFRDELSGTYGALVAVLERTHAASRELDGSLRFGLWPTAGGAHLLAIIDAFEQRNPRCSVELVEVDYTDVHGGLVRGELDAMCAWLPIERPDVVVGPVLAREPRVVAVARDHPLARADQVSVEMLADFQVAHTLGAPPELVKELIPTRTPAGRPIRRYSPLPKSIHESVALIARGRIVHPTVPSFAQHFGHPDIVTVPLTGLRDAQSALVWKRRASDPRLRAFIQTARETLAARAKA